MSEGSFMVRQSHPWPQAVANTHPVAQHTTHPVYTPAFTSTAAVLQQAERLVAVMTDTQKALTLFVKVVLLRSGAPYQVVPADAGDARWLFDAGVLMPWGQGVTLTPFGQVVARTIFAIG